MRKLTACITAILSATLLMSCQSAKVEYVDKPTVPSISFPIFPALTDATKNDDGTVTVSGGWLVQLAEYKIRIEETEKNYNELKSLYEDSGANQEPGGSKK